VLPDLVSVGSRILSFACLLQAAGAVLFLAAFGRRLATAAPAIRRIGGISAIAGALFVLLHYGLEAGRMAGALAGIFDSSLQQLVLESSSAPTAAMRILGLLLIALGMRGDGDFRMACALIGATLAASSFILTGHTSVHAGRWILAPLLGIHLLVVAFWFGALAPLYLISLREPPAQAAKIIAAFSSVAAWLVPAILLAGILMAVMLIPELSVLGEPYGALLLAKVFGFAALMGLAAANKWRLGPAIASGDSRVARRLRQSIGTEYALIFAVIAITAIMTSLFSPEH